MAAESDDNGNHALHLFVSNKSYNISSSVGDSHNYLNRNAVSVEAGDNAKETNVPHALTEHKILAALLKQDGEAASIRNNMGQLPLGIAMKTGRRQAIAILTVKYSEAVLLDDSMGNNKLFMYVLASISKPCKAVCTSWDEWIENGIKRRDADVLSKRSVGCLTTMFDLVQARPDIVSLDGRNTPKEGSKEAKNASKKEKWWKRLNPFS